MTPTEAIFEDLAERVAKARTLYLMGETAEARALLREARKSFDENRAVLAGVAGVLALAHAIEGAERGMLA